MNVNTLKKISSSGQNPVLTRLNNVLVKF